MYAGQADDKSVLQVAITSYIPQTIHVTSSRSRHTGPCHKSHCGAQLLVTIGCVLAHAIGAALYNDRDGDNKSCFTRR